MAISTILPCSNPVSKKVIVMRQENLKNLAQKALFTSIQGLVNRKTPCLYQSEGVVEDDFWVGDYYREKGYINTFTEIETVAELVSKFRNSLNGAVIWDPRKLFTLNTATNIAGVYDCAMFTPELLDIVHEAGIDIKFDLIKMNFTCRYDAYLWEIDQVYPFQRNDVSACLYNDGDLRDYLIQHKIHTFWKPGEEDSEFDPRLEELLVSHIKSGEVNSPVLGFWFATDTDDDGNPLEVGSGEGGGVKLAGTYGKYTLVSSGMTNLSFHSGIRVPNSTFRQSKVRSRLIRPVEPDKTYVAWTMIDSGDAPMYYHSHIFKNQWNHPMRYKVPMSIGITPCMQYIAPGILQKLYETATEDHFFFNAISGLGYAYPLEGYADSTEEPEKILTEYFRKTEQEMNRIDLDMLGIYSHPWTEWKTEDDVLLNRYVTPLPGIRVIIADMGRNDGFTVDQPNRTLDCKTTIHHTLTRWTYNSAVDSIPFGWPDDQNRDHLAIEYMVNELRSYAKGKSFAQAMFYSWSYGPRRLRKIMDILEPEGFEFVTLYELDEMYRRTD